MKIKIRSLEPPPAAVFQITQAARWKKKLGRLRCQLYGRFQPKRKCQRGKREISASLGIHAGNRKGERERERDRERGETRRKLGTSIVRHRGGWRYSRGRTFNFQRFRVGRQFSLGQNLRRDRDDNHNRETVPPGAKEPLTLRWSPKDSVFHRGWYIRIISSPSSRHLALPCAQILSPSFLCLSSRSNLLAFSITPSELVHQNNFPAIFWKKAYCIEHYIYVSCMSVYVKIQGPITKLSACSRYCLYSEGLQLFANLLLWWF